MPNAVPKSRAASQSFLIYSSVCRATTTNLSIFVYIDYMECWDVGAYKHMPTQYLIFGFVSRKVKRSLVLLYIAPK